MALSKPITISNWHKGISASPHLDDGAFAFSIGVDTTSELGTLKQSNALAKESGSTITGKVKWIVRNPDDGDLFAVDDDHKVYTSTDAGDTWSLVTHASASAGTGNGLGIWKDHLVLVGNAKIDTYGPLSGTPAWNNAWQDLKTTSNGYNPVLHGQDDILYIGNGRYLASIQEVAGQNFDDATAGTYTYTENVLDLPEGHHIRVLEEHGLDLLLGTLRGGTSSADITDALHEAWVFPWDRNSSSFELPAFAREQGVRSLRNVNGIIYAVLGDKGEVYQYSDGFLQRVGVLPSTLINQKSQDRVDVPPQGIINHNNFPLIAYDTQSGNMPDGLYSLVDGQFNLDYVVSTLNTSNVAIGAIQSVGASFLVGWQDTTPDPDEQGIDKLGTSTYGTNLATYFESALYTVGTSENKADIGGFEIQFSEANDNAGIKIEWRKALGESWTEVVDYGSSTVGGETSKTVNFPLKTDKVQVKVTLKPANTSSNTNLKSLTIL